MRGLALVLVGIFLGTPLARASGELVLEVDGPTQLQPRSSHSPVNLTIHASCSLLAGAPPAITVQLATVAMPSWGIIEPKNTTVTISPTECANTMTVTRHESLRMSTARDAPAFAPGEFDFLAKAEDARGTSFESAAKLPVSVAFDGFLQLYPPGGILVQAGTNTTFELSAQSYANADVALSWSLAAPENKSGILIVPAGRGAAFNLTVRAPVDLGGFVAQNFTLQTRAYAVADPSTSVTANGQWEITFIPAIEPCCENRGMPPAGLPLIFGCLAIAAVIRGRIKGT